MSGPAELRVVWPRPGSGIGDAVAVLAGAPVEIAPTAQGIWMRGASLTMLHQPTPRTDLPRWAEETTGVINMIDAAAVIVSDPFMPAAPLLSELGMRVLTIEDLLNGRPIAPVDTDDDDVALMQLTTGSTGSPKAVQITHRNFVANAEAMVVGCNFDIDTDVIVSWLPCFHDMGMTGYLDRADVLRRRARQGHTDGLPARYVVVGQAD